MNQELENIEEEMDRREEAEEEPAVAEAAEAEEQEELRPEEAQEEVAEEAGPEEESELERLKRELEEARAQAAEYLEGWQRTQAEFANYRKRQEAEWQQRAQMSNVHLIAKLLPVLDDLERAEQTLPRGLEQLTWIAGIFLIKRKLEMVLETEGVKPIETEGRTFDPLYHEAVTYEEAEGYEEGQIIGEVQRGYMLGERVIRPALVRVARAPAEAVAAESTEVEGEEDAATREEKDAKAQ